MSERAGQKAQETDLIDIQKLIGLYYEVHPDVTNPEQKVAFGTSGHRGSSLTASFNEDHIAAITQAIVEYRRRCVDLILGGFLHFQEEIEYFGAKVLPLVRELEAALADALLNQPGRRVFAAGSAGDVETLRAGTRSRRRTDVVLWRPFGRD